MTTYVQTFAPLMETGVIKHGADLGGLLGVSCADLQVGPVQVGYSFHPGCIGVRLDLHQAAHGWFLWPKDSMQGGGACGSG